MKIERIGFIGLGVMGYHMALNIDRKAGEKLASRNDLSADLRDDLGTNDAADFANAKSVSVLGYDISEERMAMYREACGTSAKSRDEIYETCDVILQMLPTHETIAESIRRAVELGKPGNIILDMSSAAPNFINELEAEVREAGMYLLDSPVSGGNPMAEAGTLSIMTGGDKSAYDAVEPILKCMGEPGYTGEPGSGDAIKLINNMVGGAILAIIAEGYALAEKAGLDLNTVFEATRGGFAGGPLYDNKVPKLIARDFEPGARIAVHYKDIVNARNYADAIGADLPVTDQVYEIMHWMVEHGYADLDQAALVKYYEEK